MKKMSTKTTVLLLAVIAVLLIVLPPLLKLSVSTMSLLITVLLYMYYASAWNIMGGYTGLFSLGQAGFLLIGAVADNLNLIFRSNACA